MLVMLQELIHHKGYANASLLKAIQQHETASQWKDGGTFLMFQTNVSSDVQSVVLGDEYTPDINRKDNEWTK